MNSKKWPFFVDWEETLRKDRATREFAEIPQDAIEEMEITQEVPNDMCLRFLIVVVDEDVASDSENDVEEIPARGGDQATKNVPGILTGAANGPSAGTTQGSGRQQAKKQAVEDGKKQDQVL